MKKVLQSKGCINVFNVTFTHRQKCWGRIQWLVRSQGCIYSFGGEFDHQFRFDHESVLPEAGKYNFRWFYKKVQLIPMTTILIICFLFCCVCIWIKKVFFLLDVGSNCHRYFILLRTIASKYLSMINLQCLLFFFSQDFEFDHLFYVRIFHIDPFLQSNLGSSSVSMSENNRHYYLFLLFFFKELSEICLQFALSKMF